MSSFTSVAKLFVPEPYASLIPCLSTPEKNTGTELPEPNIQMLKVTKKCKLSTEQITQMKRAIMRVAIVALAIFAMYKTDSSFIVLAMVSVISMPAFLIGIDHACTLTALSHLQHAVQNVDDSPRKTMILLALIVGFAARLAVKMTDNEKVSFGAVEYAFNNLEQRKAKRD